MRPGPAATALLLAGGLLVAAAPTGAIVPTEEPVRLSGAGAVAGTAGIAQHRVASAQDGYAVAAWLEAVPGGGDQLMARTREPGGDWSPVVQVSSTTTGIGVASVAAFSLGTNAAGDAALAWRQQDTFDSDPEIMVFAATLDRGDDVWATARVGGQEHGVSSFHTPAAVVLPDGTAVVGWTGYVDEGHADRQIYANEGDESGWGTPVLISDTAGIPVNCEGCQNKESTDLSLAADAAGEVRALFLGEAEVSDGGGGTTQRLWVLENARDPAGGWAAAAPITSVTDPYAAPGTPFVTGDRSSAGFAKAWSVPATDTDPVGVRVAYAGVVTVFRHATASYGLPGLAVDDGHATALLSYAQDGSGHLGVVDLDAGADTWSEPSDPANGETLDSSPTPRMALHPDGSVTVVWAEGIPRVVRMTHRAAGSSTWDDSRRIHVSSDSQALPAIAPAGDGSGTLVWRSPVDSVPALLAAGFAPEQVDPEPPALTMTAPTKLLSRVPVWTVAWEATDLGGGIGGADVAESDTAWDEDAATTYALVEEDTDLTSFDVMANPGTTSGHTYCYAARGRPDGSEVVGDWSAARCTVLPVDDRTLTRVGSTWSARTGSGRWNETFLQTRRKGAALRLEGVHASILALLVEKGRGFGTVKVVLDGDLLGKVVLDGKAKKRVVVPLGQWADARTGTVVVKVVSGDGKPVRIDGLYAGQPGDAAFTG